MLDGTPGDFTASLPPKLAISLLALGLAACPGEGGSTAAIARIEVAPMSVLLTEAGQVRAIEVRAYDAAGQPLSPPSFQLSSTSAAVSVTPTGEVRADAAVGSALVRVEVGDYVSPPILVVVARPVDGAVLITDEEVSAGPVPADPSAPAVAEAVFDVTLAGNLPPVGSLILGTGEKPIAGRVTAIDGKKVTYQLAPLPTLFRDISVDVRFDHETVTGFYRASLAPEQRALSLAGLCKSEASLAALTGELEAKIDPSLDVHVSYRIDQGSLRDFELSIDGTIEASGKATLNLGAAFTAGLTCQAPLAYLPIPITGILSPFLAPIVPLNAKLEFVGLVSVTTLGVGAEFSTKSGLTIGLAYSEAEGLTPIEGLSYEALTLHTTLNVPPETGARVKATAFVGLSSGLAIGGVLARLEAIELFAGPELEVKLGSPYDVAQDDVYNTEYELKGKLGVGPGEDLEELLQRILLSEASLEISAKIEEPIARTAKPDRLTVDRANFEAGDVLSFKVGLAPEDITFPGVGYNLTEARIYLLDHATATATLIASVPATEGQTAFDLSWTADRSGRTQEDGKPTFYAFFVDGALSLVSRSWPFELGPVIGPALEVRPASATVGPGEDKQFEVWVDGVMTTVGIEWSATGGVIDASGLYHAGDTIGTYEVRARNTTSGEEATAEVRSRG